MLTEFEVIIRLIVSMLFNIWFNLDELILVSREMKCVSICMQGFILGTGSLDFVRIQAHFVHPVNFYSFLFFELGDSAPEDWKGKRGFVQCIGNTHHCGGW